MDSQTILMCVVALILGMLLFHMLKGVCGCKVVEGQGGTRIGTGTLSTDDDGNIIYNYSNAGGGSESGSAILSTAGVNRMLDQLSYMHCYDKEDWDTLDNCYRYDNKQGGAITATQREAKVDALKNNINTGAYLSYPAYQQLIDIFNRIVGSSDSPYYCSGLQPHSARQAWINYFGDAPWPGVCTLPSSH